MKTFLTTTKGKIIAGLVTVAVIAAVVIAIIAMNSGYRTIAVERVNGTTTVTNNGTKQEAYAGQHLKSGDDVDVMAQSDLILGLDSDKYVYAKENTHFWVEALGKKNNTRTTIKLDNGSSLCRIDGKLKDSEAFEVDTPNSTMSVRGTVFKTETFIGEDGERYTVVEVFEGAVFVQVKLENGQNTEENRILNAGERAVIHSGSDFSEFVKSEGSEDIDYKGLTKEEAQFLGRAIDEGRTLSITKELLFDYVEINDHDFSVKGEEVAATCTEEGYYYDICSVCGAEGEKHIISKIEHDFDDEMICKVCGKEEAQVIAEKEAEAEQENKDNSSKDATAKEDSCANGHTMEKTVVKATCTADGYEDSICSVCGYKGARTVLKATGHKYIDSTVAATCEGTGIIYHTCSLCGDSWADYTPALGHDWNHSHADATCTSDGYDSDVCNRCGVSNSSTIPAIGHSASGGYHMIDVNTHGQTCGNCGATINVQSHSFDSSAICTVCHWG